MAAYRRVYDSRHLQADCQEPGSAPEPYARQSSMGYLFFLTVRIRYVAADARDGDFWGGWVGRVNVLHFCILGSLLTGSAGGDHVT